jgi:hypothetical protein
MNSAMMAENSSRSSGGAASVKTPGRNSSTTISGGRRASSRHLASRSCQTASGSEPLQPAGVRENEGAAPIRVNAIKLLRQDQSGAVPCLTTCNRELADSYSLQLTVSHRFALIAET